MLFILRTFLTVQNYSGNEERVHCNTLHRSNWGTESILMVILQDLRESWPLMLEPQELRAQIGETWVCDTALP